jgi:hypothetical protein
MKAMLNETVVAIMGLLTRVAGVNPIQNRQAIFYRRIFFVGLTNKNINIVFISTKLPLPIV